MAEITIQDVATYLAEHGYVRWAELTARKMMTEEAMWTRLQSNYDSTRAIDSRYISFPSLSAYATQQWVSDLGYATQEWVLSRGFITQSPNLSSYVTNSALNAMGLASQSWVSQNYATQAALRNYLPLSGGTMTGDIDSQNILPATDNTYSLGTSAKRWSIIRTMKADVAEEIYAHGKIHAYGNIQPMPNSNNAYPQLGTSAARWANVLTSGVNSAGHIIPSTTETYQLGTSQYRWGSVVTKSIDATGTSSLAALIVSGSATFNNGINVATGSLTIATGSLTIGGCTISWDPDVSMLHISTGIYSDGAVTAGGVGTSGGGGGGGGLTWDNLAAATTEQIALSHLTTALAGYVELTGAQTISGVKTFSSQLTVSGRYCIGGWQQEDSYIRANDISVQGAYSLTFGLSDGSRQIYIEDSANIAVTGNVDVSGNIDTDGAMSANGNVTASGFIHNSYNSSDYLLTGNGEAISKSTLLNGYAKTSDLHSHSNKSVLDGITSNKVNNWDTAYGWGNHASAGYLTGYGYRPIIGMSGTTTEWLGSNTGVILPLTNAGGGNYQLDLSGYTFPQNVKAKGGLVSTDYNSSEYLLTGNGGAKYAPNVFNGVSVNGTTLTVTIFDTSKSVNLSNYGFLTGSGNNTFTGSNTFKYSIELNNNAGIDFYDGIDYWNFFIDFSHDSRGSFCWCTAGQDIAWLDCDGVFHASGYQNSSDLRRKNLFGDVGLSVSDIAAMPAVRFRWNSGRDTQTMHVGTIAQAWQTLLPEVVSEGSDGLLSMDYASAALVSVINVAKSVNDHERRILDLEAENRRLKTELEQLKA